VIVRRRGSVKERENYFYYSLAAGF